MLSKMLSRMISRMSRRIGRWFSGWLAGLPILQICFSWLISFDDNGFCLVAVVFLSVSCRGAVFYAMLVDDLDVAPVNEDAGVDALSFPFVGVCLNRFERMVAMFLVNTVFGMSGLAVRLAK